jgi:hypothetical protein
MVRATTSSSLVAEVLLVTTDRARGVLRALAASMATGGATVLGAWSTMLVYVFDLRKSYHLGYFHLNPLNRRKY